jgi:hypothetical protein
MALCPTIFDRNILALDITLFGQAFPKGSYKECKPIERCSAHKTDHWHRRLLRASSQRPNACRTGDSLDELAAPHCLAQDSG